MENFKENTPESRRTQNTRTVIGFLANKFNSVPFPAMSNHHKPEEIEMGEFVEATYKPSPIVVADTQLGYDESGNFHFPSLRTEHAGLQTPLNEQVNV